MIFYKKSFTLVELLITIAIIAILAQLLLPALSNARKKANEIKCLSQMKEMSTCINLYTDDYRSYPIGKNPGDNTDWTYCLRPYIWPRTDETSPLLACPLAPQSGLANNIWVSYAVHPRVMTDISTGVKPIRAGKIPHSSELILALEACQKEADSCDPLLSAIPGILTDGLATNRSNAVSGDFEGHNTDIDANFGWPRWRHLHNCSNAVFGDGHVTNIKMNTLLEVNIKTNY